MESAHGTFILAAYAITALIIGALIVRAWIDGRAQRRALAELEARGVRRRSQERTPPSPVPEANKPRAAAFDARGRLESGGG